MSTSVTPTLDRGVSPGTRLRAQLAGAGPGELMGAHDGLSARIAVEEGFTALWASGLCIATSMGVRDCDEASWTELLSVTASIVESTGAPVLVDGDAGYGNFNSARRFAARAERIGAAGVCFEDKHFPKMNSFYGNSHTLASLPEACGKILACKDGQRDPSFVVVARTEAFVAGRSVAEAVERAHAYAEAGADAVFVHSRHPTCAQIEAFMAEWDGRVPIIVAPTTYPGTSLAQLDELGVGGVIWANHSLRAAFAAIRAVCRHVRAQSSIEGLDADVASLADVFKLFDYDGLAEDARRYAECGPDGQP